MQLHKILCLSLLVCCLSLFCGCAQRVGAVVESAAPGHYTPRGESCLLVTSPLLALDPQWTEITPLLYERLKEMGYRIPANAPLPEKDANSANAKAEAASTVDTGTPAPDANTPAPDANAGTAPIGTAPGVPGAQQKAVSASPTASAQTALGHTASGQKGQPPKGSQPTASGKTMLDKTASAQTALGHTAAVQAGDAVPQVVVRVYWDQSGPYIEYVLAPLPYYHRHSRFDRFHRPFFGGIWHTDPFAARYVAEEKFLRRLIIEAVTNSSPDPSAAAPLSARDCLQQLPEPPDQLLWRTVVTSKGNLSRANRILPELVRAALPLLGTSALATVVVQGEEVQILAAE